MRIKSFLCACGAAVVVLGAASVGAATLTTTDGVLSMETPDGWVATNDPNYWFTATDGKDTITIDHLSNGEKLPEVQVANDTYGAVCQTYVSTRNEVFTVKALATETQDLESLMKIISSIKVLKYDTKTAIPTTPAPKVSEFGLRAINANYYCTGSDVNVRSGCSTDEAKLGSLNMGQQVFVNGAVTRNSQDYGWYQISFNGGTGYVNASFLSPNKPGEAPAPAQDKPYPVGDPIPVFNADGAPRGSIYEYSDGSFRDGNGVKVSYEGNGVYFNGSEYLYTSRHFDPAVTVTVTVYEESGESFTLSQGSDGIWRDNSGTVYTQVSDTEFQVYEGTRRVSVNPPAQRESEAPHALADGFTCYDSRGQVQGLLRPYSDGLYYSNDMVAYADQGDGSYYSSAAGQYLYDYNPVSGDATDAQQSDAGMIDDAADVDDGAYESTADDADDDYNFDNIVDDSSDLVDYD